ncbi:MAG: YicC family protein [Myxococcales bacterium]|nr:YicC family protein [Myxococcales bacterium]
MTGFGRGVAVAGDRQVAVELRAVNHRFLEVKVRGAPAPALEDQCVARVRERLERGAVTVVVAVERGGAGGGPHLDRALARRVFVELSALATELGVAPPTLADVVRVPGVVTTDDGAAAELAAPLAAALTAALDELCRHRDGEGQALAADLGARLALVQALVAGLAEDATAAAPAIAARLRERLDRALAPGAIPPERLAQEVALLVERADVTEELVRARAHVEAMAAALAASGPIGRRLDFLIQELGREINTTGAKSATAAISARVVQAKAELEKMREQVQNLE